MESRVHVLVLGVLVVYTVVLIVLVFRNTHALRTQHACADVAAPLCRTLATMLERSGSHSELFEALSAGRFHGLRVLVFDTSSNVLFDTHEERATKQKGLPPTDTQKEAKAAFETGLGKPRLVHWAGGTHLAHANGATCSNGTTVVVDALAL